MKPFWLAAASMLASVTAHAETARVSAQALYSSDSDEQVQRQIAAEYRQAAPAFGPKGFWSAQLGHRELTAPAGEEAFDVGRLGMSMELPHDTGLDVSGSALSGGDWSPILGAARAHWQPAAAWYAELSAERDLVDTVLAVRNRTLVDTAAASLDWTLIDWLTVVGGVSHSWFSDDNGRDVHSLRFVATPPRWPWFNVQLRGKRADSDGTGVGYFNPRRLEDYELLARVAGAPFSERWTLSLRAGAGRQYVDQDSGRPTWSLDARARGWFTDTYGLESTLACTNTLGLGSAASGEGYRYCAVNLSLIASL